MRIDEQAKSILAEGLAKIAQQYSIPHGFSEDVLREAKEAVSQWNAQVDHEMNPEYRPRLDIPFVTLDPAPSTDLDQAFYLYEEGDKIVLQYALADLKPFIKSDGCIEKEAWHRGVTLYSLSNKVPLYPPVISQKGASLLPNGKKGALLIEVDIDSQGNVGMRSVERILMRSFAKLDYGRFRSSQAPLLRPFAERYWRGEQERGAMRLEFPQQEIVSDRSAPGGIRLELRARNEAEQMNSTLSLAVNLALATMLKKVKCGVFRVMEEPSHAAMRSLRREAHALGIAWDAAESLRDLQKRLAADNLDHQRFMMEVRRAGGRARYAHIQDDPSPWHAAIAASYVHATAPMRRLGDRYLLELAYCVEQGVAVDANLEERLKQLPDVMDRCEGRANSIDRAVIDLLEAVSLRTRVGEVMIAEVVDAEAGVVQTRDSAIRSKATKLEGVKNGDQVRVRIAVADPATRTVRFEAV